MKTIAVDSETTGLDLRHGCEPFFVTIAYAEDGELRNKCWEWDVDPLTRKVIRDAKYHQDCREIAYELDTADTLVFQGGKFDITAFSTVYRTPFTHWHKVHDTLIAGHVLASNYKHDLTNMGVQYLNLDIQKYEDVLEDSVKSCRNRCRFYYTDWAVAKEGMAQIPSAKGSKSNKDDKSGLWANDGWLPKAMAKEQHYPSEHTYHTVLSTYGNADSSATLLLWTGDGRKWHGMEAELKERNLWTIYLTKLKLIRILFKMESHGATLCSERLEQLLEEYTETSASLGSRCLEIAHSLSYSLTMPKGASPNDSLRRFIFDVLKCPPQYNEKAKSDAPSLNAEAMAYYLNALPVGSASLEFIETLMDKRKVDTHIGYLKDYKRFWIPTPYDQWYAVHTHHNATGTATTRLSSSSPPTQNISTKEDEEGHSLRYCFGPRPGREWWSLDAANIELRIPAYEAGETEMIQLFERPDDPPYFSSYHLLVAHLVFPKEFEEACYSNDVKGHLDGRLFKIKHRQLYKRTKNGDLADQYSAVNRQDRMGTSDRAFGVFGAQSKLEAKFPKRTQHNKNCIKYAEKHGYIETIPNKSLDWGGKTPRGYPLLCARSEWGKIKPTLPLSYRTQGTAGEWMYNALIRCDEQLDKWNQEGFDGYITLTVHDELVFDFPYMSNCRNLSHVRILQRLMEQGGNDIGVPTPVSITYHEHTWEEGVQISNT